jgi:hypothetical protein
MIFLHSKNNFFKVLKKTKKTSLFCGSPFVRIGKWIKKNFGQRFNNQFFK